MGRRTAQQVKNLRKQLNEQRENEKCLLENEYQRYQKILERNDTWHEDRYQRLQKSYMDESSRHYVTKNNLEQANQLIEMNQVARYELEMENAHLKAELAKYENSKIMKLMNFVKVGF